MLRFFATLVQAQPKMPASQFEDLLYVTMSTEEEVGIGNGPLIHDICRSAGTAALKLGAESVERLLQHCVKMTSSDALATLCNRLPEAQTLSPTAAGALVLSAVEAKDKVMVDFLCQELPASARIDAATYGNVLLRAIELKQLDPVASALLRLPAVGQLPGTALGELLAAALKADLAGIVNILCGLPGAQQVEHEVVVELIHSAEDAWTDYGDFSREKPDRTLWGIADLKSIAAQGRRRSACRIAGWYRWY